MKMDGDSQGATQQYQTRNRWVIAAFMEQGNIKVKIAEKIYRTWNTEKITADYNVIQREAGKNPSLLQQKYNDID